MAGFSDAFSSDSLNQLFSSPALLMGLQMLAQSGPQQGNPGFGQRLGTAGMNTVQQLQQAQHSQQLNAYRQQMAQLQAQQMQMAQAKALAQQEAQQRQQQAFASPDVQGALGPLAKMLAAAGLGPDVVLKANSADNLNAHRQATLAQQASQFDQRLSHQGGGSGSGQPSGPRAPANRLTIDQPLGNDLYQRHRFNPATGGYEPWGEPFNKHATGKAKTASPADDATAAILGAEPPAAGPDLGSLPGNAPLAGYAPQPQQPIGVLPMAAQGGGLKAQTQQPGTRKPAVDDNLKAAGAAIAAGKSRQAVVSRLMQAGYTAEQIQAAGI
ncbi:hypothetical protein R6U79_12570 [Pseudomonas putida]|uniref:hypothetical protein n=1 Tax=Pseudomonas putida TaxID=303 RepID=UPI0029DE7A36|nr:hypothetical protein [Pseudomonas putida]WPK03038.1 hypothetical protein R6U79_12570 [Pseudomonas putida]